VPIYFTGNMNYYIISSFDSNFVMHLSGKTALVSVVHFDYWKY